MQRKYPWVAVVALFVALSGAATYWILKPALSPATAPVEVAAQAAAPAQTAAPTPTPTPFVRVLSPRKNATYFQAGVMVLVYGNDPYFTFNIRRKLDYLATLGVNSVGLVFPIFQTNGRSADVHADPTRTPGAEVIKVFIQEAHQRGFTVMVRPLLDEASLAAGGDWRGSIRPQPVSAWFAAYGDLMVSYATLADENGAEAFDIGTELNTLESHGSQWLDVIKRIRQSYSGLLTYSSISGTGYPTRFAKALDFLSIDAYYRLDAQPGATTAELEQAWQPGIAQLEQIVTESGMPVVITEVGTASRRGSFRAPSAANAGAPLDLEGQRRYYEAACNVLRGAVRGLYWWNMSPYAPSAPMTDSGFDPTGKPAEAELIQCFRGLPQGRSR
jgi:glycosyl hydrolase family 113